MIVVFLSFSFSTQAPVILIPQSSTSDNALMIDLGDLLLNNSFSAIKCDSHDDPAVVDKMTIQLKSLKVSRYHL